MTLALTRFERRWAHAAFDTIFPGAPRADRAALSPFAADAGGALPLGITELDLDGFLDETLATLPFESSFGLRAAIWLLALAPLFVIGKLATIASLRAEDRLRVLQALAASPSYAIRSTVMALKAIGALLYCGDARLRPLMTGHAPQVGASPIVPLRLRPTEPTPPTSHGASHEPHARIA
jgi:hypothetical protein